MRAARIHAIALPGCLALLLQAAPILAAPAIHIEQKERIEITLRAMDPTLAKESATGQLPPSGTLSLPMQVRWPNAESTRRLSVEAQRLLTAAGDRIVLNASLSGTHSDAPILSSREIALTDDSTTALFEVARSGESVLTLVVSVERSMEASFSARPVVGRAVEFAVAIEWLESGQPVTLETNHLHTFVGQSVSYAFKLGETGVAESIELTLLPVELGGETLRVEASVSGTLPDGEEGVELLSRREQWFCSSGTTSTLSTTRGTPAQGFRFQVTPRF